LNKRNKFSAAALAAALLLAPFTPALSLSVNARSAYQQQDDIPSDAEQAMFTKGQNLYNQGRYDQAVTVLSDFLKTYPRSIITDLTLLWLGRSYMQLGKIKDAEQIGQRLHAIKDTPFADIYDGELETARTEAGTRTPTGGNTNAGNTIASKTTETGKSTSKPVARKVETPTATPSPTPARLATNNTSVKQPQMNSTQTTNTASNKAPAQTQLNNSNSNSATGATQIANNVMPPSRRGMRPGRRVLNPPATNTSVASNQSPTQATLIKPPTNANTASKSAQQPMQIASNTTTARTNTSIPVARPTPPPQAVPTPTPLISSARPVENPITQPTISSPPVSDSGLPQTGGLNLTVKQVPNLVLSLRSTSEFAQPGQTVQLPLTVTNTGNKEDQFRLETDLPAEYQPSFSLAQSGSGTELPSFVTPQLTRGGSVDVILNVRVPETAADGQQTKFYVRAASLADYQVTKVADGMVNVVAASLNAATNVSDTNVMPGDTFTQTITVKNAGSSPARQTRADFVFNPNFELVNANPAPITYDRASRTAIWSMGDLGARSSRDISVTLRAVPDALAATSPLGRGAVRTQSLVLGSNFDSPSITVGKVPKARIDAVSVGLTTTPGDTTYIPFIVRNPGNAADSYELRVTALGAPQATIYADTNGDGQHQDTEPAVTQTAQIDPRGGQFPLLLKVQIPGSTPDKQQFTYNVVARSLLSGREASEANTVLTVATPRVRVRTEEAVESAAAGDTIFYRLVLINEGSGLAKNLVVNETLPEALQFVNSDPALRAEDAPGSSQRFTWRVAELAPGDTAVLRVAVRLRPNLAAETNITTRHTLSYQDTNNNSYSGQ